MNCAAFEERIAGYVSGDLAAGEASAVEQHLGACAGCAELARALAEDRNWLASRPPEALEVDFAAIRREIRRELARPRLPHWRWPAAAACVLLAVGVSLPRKSAPPVRVEGSPVVRPSRAAAPPRQKAPAVRRVHQAAEPALSLDAAIRLFQELEPPPEPAGSDSPVEMQLATSNPDVKIIILQPSNGDSR